MNKKIMMIGIAVIVVTCGYLFYENEKIKQEERDFEQFEYEIKESSDNLQRQIEYSYRVNDYEKRYGTTEKAIKAMQADSLGMSDVEKTNYINKK
jgi:hypothetical protein